MTQQTSPVPGTALDRFFDALRSLGIHRRTEGKVVGGVCGGVADRLGVDVVIVRVVTVLLVLLGGVGISAYLVAWVLLPNVHGEIPAERALRHGDGGSIVLLVITLIAVFSGFPWWFGRGSFGWTFPWGLLVIGGLAWWLWSQRPAPVTMGPPGAPQPLVAPVPPAAPGQAAMQQQAYGGEPPTAWASSSGPAGATPPGYSGATGSPPGYSGPTGSQPPYTPTTYAAPPRRRAGGLLMTLVAVGAALVAYGTTIWLADRLDFVGEHHVIALAAALGAIGLVVLGLGIAGWRAGFVGFLAVVLALVTWSATLWTGNASFVGPVGDSTWRPTTVSTATSYHLGAGNGVLELGDLPSQGLTGQVLAVSIGAGDLTIRVPSDLTVRVRAHVGLGGITLPEDAAAGGATTHSGTDVSAQGVVGSGPTELVVKADVGLGQITVVKE